MTDNHIEPGSSWIRVNYRWLLIVSCIPLFSTKALFNLPLIIMAILGAVQLYRHPSVIRNDPAIRAMLWLFLAIWLPLLFSLPDAVVPGRSSSTVARYLPLLLVGIFIIQALRSQLTRRKLYYSVVVLIVLMSIDGLIQYFLGYNLLGYPMVSGRVTGVFYPKLHIGLILAVLSPVVFEFTLNYFNRNKLVLVLPILLMMVLILAGNRVSWVMFILVAFVYTLYAFKRSNIRLTWRPLVAGLAVILITLFFASKSPFVQTRISNTAGIFSTDFKTADRATAYRLSIWKVGWTAYKANWVNGVGPRGFRYVYTTYADEDNFWMKQKNKGATHPHLMILEVAVETGTIGLIGYLLFIVFIFRYYRQCGQAARIAMFPWLLSILIAVFPLNAHMAWYASYWGAVSWWLLVVALGMANRQEQT